MIKMKKACMNVKVTLLGSL